MSVTVFQNLVRLSEQAAQKQNFWTDVSERPPETTRLHVFDKTPREE